MFEQYEILHRTTYRYAEPVRFGEHRVLFRPRESHDLRVLASDLKTNVPSSIHLVQDMHSNSVALVQPGTKAPTLEITSSFVIEHAYTKNLELPVAQVAEYFPFAYSVDERIDLEHYLRPHLDDPDGTLTQWARQFMRTDGPTPTRDMLVRMNQHIRQTLRYSVRHEEGTQSPLETLKLGRGTCRDFAFLMMEAMRRLGIAARFVSGYLYDPSLDKQGGNGPRMVGSGSTHGWLQAYLPGAGWIPFDPTNNLLGGTQLIRVGLARHPSQAAPVSGTWFGQRNAYLGMDVQVEVRRRSGNRVAAAKLASAGDIGAQSVSHVH